MSNVLFKEKQRYSNQVVLALFGGIGLVAILRGMFFLMGPHRRYIEAAFLFAIAFTIGGVIWWLRSRQLKVSVSRKNIKFKMSPMPFKKQVIAWKDVETCEIIKTSEAALWSGWNISFNHERRYSLSGRNGLAIKTKDGARYFIGCKNLAGLQRALSKINPAWH